MPTVRKTGGRDELDAIITLTNALVVDMAAKILRDDNGVVGSAALAAGTTNGKIKSVNATDFKVAGQLFSKGATDDEWNLSAQSSTDGTHYRAFWLYRATNGTASIAAGADTLTSAALAIAALPALDATKSVIGVYVAAPSTNFANALTGTFINGWPAAQTATGVAITSVAP